MNQVYSSHPIIAKEGWPFIAIALVVTISIAFWSWLAAIPFFLILVFVVQFFRDPRRVPTPGEGLLLAPADGRIVAVEEVTDPYVARKALKISVFMNVFNVHSNRMPLAGQIEQVQYFPGKFLNADLDKASLENERNAIVIKTPDGQTVTSVQVAGLVARRILCFVQAGQKLLAGQRYGFIRFGSRVDVYLPMSARPKVVIGDKVRAAHSVLAELPKVVDESAETSAASF